MRMYYVYALLDPISTQVFYVGQTDSIKRTKSRHKKRRYCRWLKAHGYQYELIVLETTKRKYLEL